MSSEWSRTYPAQLASVERAARDLCSWALRSRIGPAVRARLAGTIAELVDNAVRHAFPRALAELERGVTPEVRLSAVLDERTMVVSIADSGVGFVPCEPGRVGLDACRDGGLARASALSEDLRIESAPDEGTRIQVTFGVTSSRLDGAGAFDLSDLDFFLPQDARLLLDACARPGGAEAFHLSPALAVVLGRLLSGPDPRRALQTALGSGTLHGPAD